MTDQFTTFRGLPLRKACMLAAVAAMRRFRASRLAQAMWGVRRQCFAFSNGFSLRIGSKSATWLFLVCARDSEARDGVGLPGRHDCGGHRVRANVSYLG